jgi:spermidine synthase
MIFWLAEIGLISILGQVVLLRELNVAFFGSELIYILALGIWLLWTAVGASVGRRAFRAPLGAVRGLFLATGLAIPAAVVFIRRIHLLFDGVRGEELPFEQQVLAMSISLLPVGILLGLLFQQTARLAVESRRTLAFAYAVESGGGLIGGAAATVALAAGFSNLAIALWCSLAALAAAIFPVVRAGERNRPGIRVFGPTLAAVLLASGALVRVRDIDAVLTAWSHHRLLATRDTPYGRITVTGSDGQISVFRNNALVSDNEGVSGETFVHLAALQHPEPESILILGGGFEELHREAARHRPRRIDRVELDRRAFRLVSDTLRKNRLSADGTASASPVFSDPRAFLKHARRKYDLILVGMPEPSSAQANRYFTREFFALCAARLSERGVLALRLRGAENIWTPHLLERAASIERALSAHLAEVVVLPGDVDIFLASNVALPRDPELLADRLEQREIEARMVSPAYIRYRYTNDRFRETRNRLRETKAPVNSDAFPVCYRNTVLIWLSRFYPELAMTNVRHLSTRQGAAPVAIGIATAILAGFFWLSRRRTLLASSLLAAVAGFLGMVTESALILQYQVNSGILFQDLGILITLFMAGLSLGSGAVHLAALRHFGGSPPPWLGTALSISLAALSPLAFGSTVTEAVAPLATTGLFLFLCGALTAALFAYASLRGPIEQRLAVSPLYAADLLGGCLGSLLSGLVLLPFLGLPGTATAAFAVALTALIPTWTTPRTGGPG